MRPPRVKMPSAERQRPTLALRVSEALLIGFTTAWAVAYYIAYFRSPIYLLLIATAIAIDCARLSSSLSSRIFRQIRLRKAELAFIVVCLFALQCWAVLSGELPELAFVGPYKHFLAASPAVSMVYAASIYVSESAGALIALLIIIYYGIRLASSDSESILQEAERRLRVVERDKEISKLPLFFLLVYALQISVVAISVQTNPGALGYHPQTNPFELALFAAAPALIAVGMRAWSREVTTFLRLSNSTV
jgi:hypothetical protein